MARGLNRRQQRITEAFDALCEAVGAALGAAEGRRESTIRAHAEAMAETWLRTEGLDAVQADGGMRPLLTNPALSGPLERVRADRREAFAGWLEDGPRQLADILQEAAPGAAGLAPEHWLARVGAVDGSGPVPSLWSIGTGRIEDAAPVDFPVAVPLLDESHLQVSSGHEGRARAEALVEGLLLRVMSYFRPGIVQLHVWDVGQFTGALPGLYPLTRTGLLTVHDPAMRSESSSTVIPRCAPSPSRRVPATSPGSSPCSSATGHR